jgi:hypothetical protein
MSVNVEGCQPINCLICSCISPNIEKALAKLKTQIMRKPPFITKIPRNWLLAVSLGGVATGVVNAQFAEVVASDDFNSYANNGFVVASNGTTSLVADGGGGNALQYTTTTGGGGFFASGFDWVPIVQPGPGGPNISTALTDYQVSFKLTINSDYKPANGIEIWLKDESTTSANLYATSVTGFVKDVPQTVSFTIQAPVTTTPFGYPSGAFTPTLDQLRIRMNGLDFGSPASTVCTFTIDDFSFNTVTAGSADGDTLPDVWELIYYNPVELYDDDDDFDLDGFNTLAEYNAGSNPMLIESVPGDIDGDGLGDLYEDEYFGNFNGIVEPTDLGQTPFGDFDDDFVSNIDEQTADTLPNNSGSWPDTDNDEMNDGFETAYGLNVGVNDAAVHSDADGFTNLEEHTAGTNPLDSAWSPAKAFIKHRWSFTNDLNDSAGSANALIFDPDSNPLTGGVATQNATSVTLGGGVKAESDYILLGNNLLSALHADAPVPVTIELWATPHGAQNWSRIFDFGTDNGSPGPNQSLRMTWSRGTNTNEDQVEWQGKGASLDTNSPYQFNVPYHMVMTIVPAAFTGGALTSGARVEWYTSPAASSQLKGHPIYGAKGSFNVANSNLDDLADAVCFLGRSMYNDNTAKATYDEVRIWAGALTETERELFQLLGPDNIDRTDSEPDGFPDAWEMARFGNLTTATAGVDSDLDGEDDDFEFSEESNPNNLASTSTDTDADGLNDLTELNQFNNLLPNGTGGPVDYDSWAIGAGLTPNANDGAGQNPENDPFANILEYQLGGNPLAFDGDLLTSTDNGTSLIFTFDRSDISEGDSTLIFRWSTNLATWNLVPIGATSSAANGDGVIVTVTEDGGTTSNYDLIKVEVPKTNAVGGKLFGQLEGKSQP